MTSAADSSRARAGAWTRYWSEGALHSCPGSYAGNYAGSIARFWRQQFENLERTHRVIDLGTGNGPIPALMVEVIATSRFPQIDAFDIAEPRPDWLAQIDDMLRQRLHFHSNVAIESLPLGDASIDRVYAQFAFEYAQRSQASAEICRVLKPEGQLAMLMHHADSRLAQVAALEVEMLDWFLLESTLPECARAMLAWMALAASAQGRQTLSSDASATQCRQRFNLLMQQLSDRAAQSQVPDTLLEIGQALMQQLGAAPQLGAGPAQQGFDQWLAQLADARLRSAELVSSALSEDELGALKQDLAERGCEVLHVGVIEDQGWLIGWSLVAQRR